MEIDKIIRGRRAYYPAQYSGEAIEQSVIERLLENANWAPNHMHTEPWRFKVWSGESLKRLMLQFAQMYRDNTDPTKFSPAKIEKYENRAEQVSHAIVIAMKRHDRPGLPETEEISAVSCAVQNMWLTLAAIDGIGGYWSTGSLVYSEDFHHFLELDDDETCLGVFYIGKIKEGSPEPQGRRGDWKEKVSWVTS